ncbi:MAG TPA: lipid A biosynthesis lauroyl acyltransferase [Porticoccaceae bacterium]|nr:lipid A biosynthesis lauroyl acyltransferase [Porticoccaceae bacterium]
MTQETPSTCALMHPRHWIRWLLFLLWWLVIQLPYPMLLRLGKMLGLFLFLFNTRRKHIAQRNIELCFPDLNRSQQHDVLRANFISMGIAVAEIGIAWWWPKRRFQGLLSVEGVEHLTDEKGRGTLLLGIHYTTLEVGAAAATMLHDKVDGMYRAHGNPVYDFVQARGRLSKRKGSNKVYERKDVRGSLKALKNGRILWYGPDQDYGLGSGLFAPFFGIPAATVDTTARFAKVSGARVVPFSHIRLPHGKGYKVTFHKPLDRFPVGDDLVDAIRINQLVEAFILLQPEQYLWAHRRFKNRPEGQPNVYTEMT